MKPVYTFAKWRVKEGQLVAVLELLADLTEKSTAEEGNLLYKIHQSISDANTLILFEGYSISGTPRFGAFSNAGYWKNYSAP